MEVRPGDERRMSGGDIGQKWVERGVEGWDEARERRSERQGKVETACGWAVARWLE